LQYKGKGGSGARDERTDWKKVEFVAKEAGVQAMDQGDRGEEVTKSRLREDEGGVDK
jgi:hypothetical protein